MNKKTNISVIIPTYNSAKTLYSTVRSCLNQTLSPIEVLVCDDGSSDNSKEIIEQINDSRIIWVPSKHSGTPAIPRNNGLRICKGEWIAFCDSDDEWLQTKLEKQILLVTELKYKAVCTNALIKINSDITSKKVSNWKNNTLSFKNLLKTNDVVCSSAMIHSSIYKEIGGFSEIVEYGAFADYIYWLRVSTKTDFAFVNESLVIYDDHPETSIRSNKISDFTLKKLSFNNFTIWTKKQRKIKLYFFILQIKIYFIVRWIKNLLYDKINYDKG